MSKKLWSDWENAYDKLSRGDSSYKLYRIIITTRGKQTHMGHINTST